MNYRNIILDTIHSSNYRSMNMEGWKNQLSVSSADEFRDLVKSLTELENEYVIARDSKDRYDLIENLGYIKGTLSIHEKGFGFVENDIESVYINPSNVKGYFNHDEVIAKVKHNYDDSVECEIVKVIKHSLEYVVGVIKKQDGKTRFLPDKQMGDVRFKITNLNEFKLVNDTKVQIKIDIFGKTVTAHIVKIIGHKYDPGVDILSILLEHNIDPAFPQEVLDEVNEIPDEVQDSDLEGRRDLTDELIITIDGEDARDLDDAISCCPIDGGYRLGVHIADVSYYVKEGTFVNDEAYYRGTSVYVVDRVVPMLPHSLSNGICSLNPKVKRLTISCVMDIDVRGEIFNYEIFPSFIKTTERMTYTNVNKILDQDPEMCKKYSHLLEMCKDMANLSKIIRRRRNKLGAIDFDKQEAKIIVDENCKPVEIVPRTRGISERIIEDFMIAANECVATHVKWLEYPSMYRVHEIPDVKKMREFAGIASIMGYKLKGNLSKVKPVQLQRILNEAKGKDEYQVLSTYMLRSMQKARYDRKCIGHFGLGLEEYTHFTSPIRRYPDLVVHRMLRKYCFEGVQKSSEFKKDEKWIDDAAVQSSKQERNAVDTEREVDDMKMAEYMEKYIGCEFTGVISSVTNFGFFVELENLVEGLVHVTTLTDDYYHLNEVSKCLVGERTNRKYRMGQKVRVVVAGASRYKRQVDFELVKR